jgi:hypothetical protein
VERPAGLFKRGRKHKCIFREITLIEAENVLLERISKIVLIIIGCMCYLINKLYFTSHTGACIIKLLKLIIVAIS